ncbi:MAG: transposase [Lachnospiraceae bacterium]|nr:transposase [Lachnospiraceae bacterium]
MSRKEREKSEYGIYHVMLRGVNRQRIFEDNEDNFAFLSILATYKKKCEFELFAYCLMRNHVHMLIREGEMELPDVIRRVATTYAQYFNRKYGRVGHLFQDRYRSEAVKSEEQLIQTLRYIHRNPVKAGICEKMEEYTLSSYRQYVLNEWGIADTGFIMRAYGIEQVTNYPQELMEKVYMDVDEKVEKHVTNAGAKNIYEEVSRSLGIIRADNLCANARNAFVRELRKRGLSVSQIACLSGLKRNTISRA